MVMPPSAGDGRHLDPGRALVDGEAAGLEVEAPEVAWPVAPEAHPTTQPRASTYYDLPIVKPAPWKWYVPAYFYAGGVAGAAASLAAALEVAGREQALARRLHWIAAGGEVLGGALLIADLGRPARFHHMLRVVRPTSPMNVGTWILSASGATSAIALVWPGRAAGVASGITGALLTTYTGVLIGNTAVPLWRATRRRLPPWFAASSAAGLASLAELALPRARVVRRYAVVAKAAELATARWVERGAFAASVGAPLREGRSGRLHLASWWLGAASLASTLLGRPRLAGALGTAAAIAARFAIVDAGRASAADPHATLAEQRVDAAAQRRQAPARRRQPSGLVKYSAASSS